MAIPGTFSALPEAAVEMTDPDYSLGVAPRGGGVSIIGQAGINQQACFSLATGSSVGTTVECGATEATLTFPHPVTDPLLNISAASFLNASGAGNVQLTCTAAWGDTAVTAVNGTAPAAGRVTAVSVDPSQTYANERVSFNPGYVQAESSCDDLSGPTSGFTQLQLTGLVSSVTFSHERMVTVLVNNNGTLNPPSSISENSVSPAVPSADLRITNTAPATTAPGAELSWEVNVTNDGAGDSHGFVVHDAFPAVVASPRVVSSPIPCTVVGRDLRCSSAPSGFTATPNPVTETVADLSGGDDSATIPTVLPAGASSGPIELAATAPSAADTITTTAVVGGVDTDPNPANNSAAATTEVVAPRAALDLTMTADASAVHEPAEAGDVITYAFRSVNTGDTPLNDVEIQPTLTGLAPLVYTWPAASGVLEPGQAVTATATYAITDADIAAKSVLNTAVAAGLAPDQATVTSDEVTATTPLVAPAPVTPTPTPTPTPSPGVGTPIPSPGTDPANPTASGDSAERPGSELAWTGAELTGPAIAASVLLGIGAVLLEIRRRRRNSYTADQR